MDRVREQRIRDRAYFIWIHEGYPEGRHQLHWWLACEDIEREDMPPAWWGTHDRLALRRTKPAFAE